MNDDFRTAINTKVPRPRMVDVELIIRFLALREDLVSYRPPLPRFLNNYCTQMNKATEEQLDAVETALETAAFNVRTLYGRNAFRLTGSDGALLDRNFNRGLAEAQLRTLSYADSKQVTALKDRIVAELGELHQEPSFLDNIQRAIVDRSRTLGRMQQYKDACIRAGLRIND